MALIICKRTGIMLIF